MRGRNGLIAALLAMAFAGLATADVTIELTEDFPVRGRAVDVRVMGGDIGETYSFSVTYRPNSETSAVEDLGGFSPEGRLSWTPVDAGITSLNVIDDEGGTVVSRNIAVRYESPPLSGLLIFILAGILLFGGSTVFMRRALEG